MLVAAGDNPKIDEGLPLIDKEMGKQVVSVREQTKGFFVSAVITFLLLLAYFITASAMNMFTMSYMTHWGLVILDAYLLLRIIGNYYPRLEVVTVVWLLPFTMSVIVTILVGVHYVFFYTTLNIASYQNSIGVAAVYIFGEHYLTAFAFALLTASEFDRVRDVFACYMLRTEHIRYAWLATAIWQLGGFLLPFGMYGGFIDFQSVYQINKSLTDLSEVVVPTGVGTILLFWIYLFYPAQIPEPGVVLTAVGEYGVSKPRVAIRVNNPSETRQRRGLKRFDA